MDIFTQLYESRFFMYITPFGFVPAASASGQSGGISRVFGKVVASAISAPPFQAFSAANKGFSSSCS